MKRSNAARVGHLPTRRKWNVYIASIAVWLTGVVWVLLHYFIDSVDEFGFPQQNPAEHWTLIAHVAFGFWAVWLFGVLWPNHVKKSWRARIRRGSGGTLFGFTTWLVLTGFLLIYLGNEMWLEATSLAHWISGIGAAIPFAIHLITRQAHRATETSDQA